MIIQIEYICAGTGTSKNVKSVRLCNDLRFNGEDQSINPASADTAWIAFRCDKSNTDLIRKLLNDPTKAKVTVANNRATMFTNEVNVSACSAEPNARAIAEYPTDIRPAAYRAGATSVFRNL